jgi:D-glycero-beta-D-manno-heptose-7-phosphate kinase
MTTVNSPGAPAPEIETERLATPAIANSLTRAVRANGTGSPRRRLLGVLERFAGKRVLVVGDMVADEYVVGTPARISREAPVLILERTREFTVPGGATNPGVNARTLGAEVYLAGVIGDDVEGERLSDALEKFGVHQDGLVREAGRPTSTKTRILAGSPQLVQQQIVRVDRVDRSALGADCERAIVDYITEVAPSMDAILISDYEIGVVTQAIITCCLAAAREHGKVVVVDSHVGLARFQGATALTPNEPEAAASLGMRITDQAGLEEAGTRLLEATNSQGVLITRGSEGMCLFERERAPFSIPVANLTEVRDTTGAGDTVAATFTLGLVAGAGMPEAAVLADIAAGQVVRRLGCATTTPQEMRQAITELVRA